MSPNVDKQAALELAHSLDQLPDQQARIDAVERIMALGGFAPGRKIGETSLFESFDEDQREMLRAIARRPGVALRTGAGVPHLACDLRRWAGVNEPGPLEQLIDAGARQLPRWNVFQDSATNAEPWPQARARALAGLDPVDELESLFRIQRGSYGIQQLFKNPVTPQLIADATDAGAGRAIEWARDLVNTIAEAELDFDRFGNVTPAILSPLLRAVFGAGHPLPPQLDVAIEWISANRPLFESLPPSRRETAVLRVIAPWGPVNFKLSLGALEELADLLVSGPVLDELDVIIARHKLAERYGARVAALRQKR